ncbi:GvpL/GvpF family gas vesicle protein [Kutzneria buriramensis]|uniref:Gas vesicle protein GvpL/GvpF n=1 Tax=Kutzneria buriramensis TaxID=1045776 RepID=A0A3E0HHU5_9PSEU|nr:GvpL/GvpF family gas vesicle protein [Kutzneria buriramensis]REH46003.1 gas vesicle protein GvpL/GvpF [Kutzneria buriramensis]
MIPSSPPAGASSPPNDRPSPDTAVYAYTITRWSPPDPAAPVRVVTHRDIAMLVADVDPAEFTEPAMIGLVRRHHTVVREAFEHGTVLPLRFATMFADDDAVRRLLRECHDEVVATLAAIAGHREWGVRIPRPQTAPAAGISGTDYLALRRRERDGDQLHRRLARHTSRSTVRQPGPGFRLDAVYLVPDQDEDEFLAEVDSIGGEVETTGPWPPYSFSELRTAAR